MPQITWDKPKAPKQVEKLFEAKKEVTKKDAKKLNPLTQFWERKIQNSVAFGVILGGMVASLVFLVLSLIDKKL